MRLRLLPSGHSEDYFIVIHRYFTDTELDELKKYVESIIDELDREYLIDYSKDNIRIVRDDYNDATYINIYTTGYGIDRIAHAIREKFGEYVEVKTGPMNLYFVITAHERTFDDIIKLVDNNSEDYKLIKLALEPDDFFNKLLYRDERSAILIVHGHFSTWSDERFACYYKDGTFKFTNLKKLKYIRVTVIDPMTNEARSYP